MLFYQILAYNMHGIIYKKTYKNNKLKIPASTWNEQFKLPDGSYSASDIPDCFEYILKSKRKRLLIFQ